MRNGWHHRFGQGQYDSLPFQIQIDRENIIECCMLNAKTIIMWLLFFLLLLFGNAVRLYSNRWNHFLTRILSHHIIWFLYLLCHICGRLYLRDPVAIDRNTHSNWVGVDQNLVSRWKYIFTHRMCAVIYRFVFFLSFYFYFSKYLYSFQYKPCVSK